jgi:hypothetical protein
MPSRSFGRQCLLHSSRSDPLAVPLLPVTNPAAFLAEGVIVRPVHEAPEVVPFIHSAKPDAIAHADRNPGRHIKIIRNQHSLPTWQLHDESLVA